MNADDLPFLALIIGGFAAFMIALGFGSIYASLPPKSRQTKTNKAR